MEVAAKSSTRATTLDDVFDYLYEQIVTLNLAPGEKISEADIAARFGVSRQPVRDAFRRLENIDLLVIRPQRATVVKRFSKREIEKSRFVRQAVEKEVLFRAAQNCDRNDAASLDEALARQVKVMQNQKYDEFGELDYEFHKILCQIAKADYAFDVIVQEKSKVDRLCRLALSRETSMPALIDDHQRIAEAVKSHNEHLAIEEGMRHLSRLSDTISQIYEQNANYFDE